jgi:hypothetical protein
MRKPSASTQVVQTPNQLSPPPAEAQMPPVQTRTDRTRLLLHLLRKLMQVRVSRSTWFRTLLPELRWTAAVVQKRWVDRKLRRSTLKVSYLVVGMPFVNNKRLDLPSGPRSHSPKADAPNADGCPSALVVAAVPTAVDGDPKADVAAGAG